jgi:hypothetical protein
MHRKLFDATEIFHLSKKSKLDILQQRMITLFEKIEDFEL